MSLSVFQQGDANQVSGFQLKAGIGRVPAVPFSTPLADRIEI